MYQELDLLTPFLFDSLCPYFCAGCPWVNSSKFETLWVHQWTVSEVAQGTGQGAWFRVFFMSRQEFVP